MIDITLPAESTAAAEPVLPEPAIGAIARQRAYRATQKRTSSRYHPRLWAIAITHPGSRFEEVPRPTADHRPTVLTADWRPADIEAAQRPVEGPGALVYRGACLGCEWEGPIREEENAAVEDAHDHTHPGWRQAPAVQPCRPATALPRTTGGASGFARATRGAGSRPAGR